MRKVFGNTPDSFLPKELIPITNVIRIKDDQLPESWSVNKYFTVGQIYPVYNHEGEFVIGSNGQGYKVEGNCWKSDEEYLWEEIYYFLEEISNTNMGELSERAKKFKKKLDEL